MSINGVRNPAKLRKVSALIGEPCVYAAARWFVGHDDWLAFGDSGAAYVVNLKQRTSEPYREAVVKPYRNAAGVICGVEQEGSTA